MSMDRKQMSEIFFAAVEDTLKRNCREKEGFAERLAKMSRLNRVTEPPPEVMVKICQAQRAVASQKMRTLKCPYCGRSAIIVFEDTRGHIQTKCKHCGQEVVFDTTGVMCPMS